MAEARDEDVRARYRALATEEPPAAIDDAIRAAARRAVSSAPGAVKKRATPRWAVPASIAAVLMLSFGVVIQMQTEAPKTELEMRAGSPPVFSQPPTAMAPLEQEARPEDAKRAAPGAPAAKLQAEPPPAAKARAPEPAKRVLQEKLVEKKDARAPEPQAFTAEPRTLAKEAPAAPVAAPPAPPPAPQPKAFADAAPAAPAAAAPSAPPAPARDAMAERNVAPARRDEASGSLGLAARAKTEGLAASRATASPSIATSGAARAEPWPDTPEKKLERIESLRREGRDREADEAIARFRREHPDYRIPEDAWNRIKPR